MTRQFLKDAFGWGVGLWLIGYVLGIVLFMIVPPNLIGWIITPIGLLITMFVLLKKVRGESLQYYVFLALIWLAIAVIFDYLFLVKVFKPADGYYKLDIYLYYFSTIFLPLLVGWIKTKNNLVISKNT